ncbi:MAG: response regulator [Pirellulaceae bacterium]
MSGATFFVQDCPVCGRYLQVRLKLLGKSIACPHCRGNFVARDPATTGGYPVEPSDSILTRANELLSSAESSRQRPR